eukprot:871643-Pyramimonas_sp.AAC.1
MFSGRFWRTPDTCRGPTLAPPKASGPVSTLIRFAPPQERVPPKAWDRFRRTPHTFRGPQTGFSE